MSEKLRLISRWQNSAGERVRIALHLKGIDFDYVPRQSLSAEAFFAINPQGLLPALQVDGRVIAQSSAILEYIEETRPGPSLLPADPVLRAQTRAFAAHITSEMHALTVNRVRMFVRDQLGAGDDGATTWVRHWINSGLAALEATLAARESSFRFCFSDQPGWADLHLVPQMAAARRLGCDLAPYARLLSVEALCDNEEAFVKARPENQPDYPGPPSC